MGILVLNAVLISGKKTQTPTKNQNYVKNKNYLKSECSSTTKSSESQFRIFFKKIKPSTLDPMNAKIDLVTFNYAKKISAFKKKKYFGLLTLFFVAIATEISW